MIVDDPVIAELNHQYLQPQRPDQRDCISNAHGEFAEITPGLLGDVVISSDTAAKEAADAGISLEQRFRELLVHGILHLFGYDHENDEAEALRMEEKSTELLTLMDQKETGNVPGNRQ